MLKRLYTTSSERACLHLLQRNVFDMAMPKVWQSAIERHVNASLMQRGLKRSRMMLAGRDLFERGFGPARDLATGDDLYDPTLDPSQLTEMESLGYAKLVTSYDYAMALRTLKEALLFLDVAQPITCLNLCAGSGATLIAFETLLTEKSTSTAYYLVEQRHHLRKILSALVKDVKVDATCHVLDSTEALGPTQVDLVVLSAIANAFSPKENVCLQQVQEGWNRLKPGGIMVLADHGSPPAYQRLMAIRDHLISQGGLLQAPCPHQLTCPHHHCAFKQTYYKNKDMREVLPGIRDVAVQRFQYLIFQKEGPGVKPEEATWQRIVQVPQKDKALIRFQTCHPSGRLDAVTVRRHPLHASREGKTSKQEFVGAEWFGCARKIKLGDIWPTSSEGGEDVEKN